MSKSEGKKIVQQAFPKAFVETKDVPYDSFQVGIVDAAIKWFDFSTNPRPTTDELEPEPAIWQKKLKAAEEAIPPLPPSIYDSNVVTGWHLLRHMIKECAYLFKYTNVKFYVMCFDKSMFVPKAKDRTQYARAKSTSNIEEFAWNGVDPIVTLDAPLPNWASLNKNRAARFQAQCELIQLVKDCFKFYKVDQILIIDGWTKNPDFITFPLVVCHQPSANDVDRSLHIPTTYKNKCGEADLSMMFYLEKFSDLDMNILCQSKDTDMVWLQLLHARARTFIDPNSSVCFRNLVYHQLNARLVLKSDHKTAPPPVSKKRPREAPLEEKPETVYVGNFIDVNSFFREVSLATRGIEYGAEAYVIAATAAVNDFGIKIPYRNVPQAHFINAYLKYRTYIGELMHFSRGISCLHEKNFTKLVQCAYIQKHVSKGKPDAPLVDPLDYPINGAPLAAVFPNARQMWARTLHAWWFVQYMIYGVSGDDRYVETPLDYAYSEVFNHEMEKTLCLAMEEMSL